MDGNRVIDVNFKGVYLCSKQALPDFPESGGSIINMSSVTGFTGLRRRAAYSAAKGAIVSLTRSMALHYASRGIRVNACVRALNIGLIVHKFMGKAHSHALRDLAMFLGRTPVMKVLCGIEDDLEETAGRSGWQSSTRSWRNVVDNPDIDVIDIATPGNTHCEIAVSAAQKGEHILCEKPLALNTAEASRMLEAAERNGIRHMVNFNYRRVPAVILAKKLIEEGRLGRIYTFRRTYYRDWRLDPTFPHIWRMDKETAGAGSSG